MVISNNIIETLLDLPECSIWGFFHERSRRVYLCYSYNTRLGIARNLNLLAIGDHSCKHLQDNTGKYEIRIIQKCTPEYLIDEYGYMLQVYEGMKYTVLNARIGSRLRFYSEIATDGLVYTKVAYTGDKRVITGVFNKMYDAEEFLDKTYRRMKIVTTVFAINARSLEYFRNMRDL